MSAGEMMSAIRARVGRFVTEQYRLWREELSPALRAEGVVIHDIDRLSPRLRRWTRRHFDEQVFPVLTPIAVDPSHPFPQVPNKSHNLVVLLRRPGKRGREFHGVVPIPRVLPRLVRLPAHLVGEGWHYVFLKSLIAANVHRLFPGLRIGGCAAFRVTRNSDLYIDEEEAENLLRTIEEELRNRNRGRAVRIELQASCPPRLEKFLLDVFQLTAEDVYRVEGPVTLTHLAPLYMIEGLPRLKDRPFIPVHDLALPPDSDPFAVLRRQDVLLHHPFETFDSLIDLLDRAARDPDVLAVKIGRAHV